MLQSVVCALSFAFFGQVAVATPSPTIIAIGSRAAYTKAYQEEKNKYVAMTYSNIDTCTFCRTLAGTPHPGDQVLLGDKTIPGLAAKYAGTVSFYEMDMRKAEVARMFIEAKGGSLIPFTGIFRYDGGKMTYMGQVTGTALAEKLEELKL